MITIEDQNINQTDNIINGLGNRLKSAREAKSLTAKEAATHLHLSVNIINIIENERFTEGPPPTFMRGYVRSYARFLNIPDHEIHRALQELETAVPIKSTTLPILHTRSIEHPNRYLNWITYLIGITLIILVGLWWNSHQRYVITDVPPITATAPTTATTSHTVTVTQPVNAPVSNSTTGSVAVQPATIQPATTSATESSTAQPIAVPTTESNTAQPAAVQSASPTESSVSAQPVAPTMKSSNPTQPAAVSTTTLSTSPQPPAPTTSTTGSSIAAPTPTTQSPTAIQSTTTLQSAPIPVPSNNTAVSPPQVDLPPMIAAIPTPADPNAASTPETTASPAKPTHKNKGTRHATLPGMPGINMALPEPN